MSRPTSADRERAIEALDMGDLPQWMNARQLVEKQVEAVAQAIASARAEGAIEALQSLGNKPACA